MHSRISDAAEIEKSWKWLSQNTGRTVNPVYFQPETVDETIGRLRQFGADACVVAGGTDVLGLLKNRIIAPRVLVDLKNVPGFRGIISGANGLSIGTMTLINDLERSELIKNRYSSLWQAARAVGSPQIRNMGTVAGNLCQEVRCWYYRHAPDTGITYNCRRKSADAKCYAVNGENQYHAILDGNQCWAASPSDLATSLAALDASVRTVSGNGGRVIPVAGLYTNLGTVLGPDEIITEILIPEVNAGTRQLFLKFRVRQTIDFAIASAAVVMTVENETITAARVVLGGVAPVPYRAVKAEPFLVGEKLTEEVAHKAAWAAIADAHPLSRNAYKVEIAAALVKRAILD